MSKRKLPFLAIILLMPLLASAHGEDVLFTFGLSLVLALIYIVVLFFFKASFILKILAVFVYIVSIILVYRYIDDMPYNDNKVYINCVVGFVPSIVGIVSLLILKLLRKANK